MRLLLDDLRLHAFKKLSTKEFPFGIEGDTYEVG